MDNPNSEFIVRFRSDLNEIPTAHLNGVKQIFLSATESNSEITQVAYGKLRKDELVEAHMHNSMEEMYYFLKGIGKFSIGEKEIAVTEGVFVKISAGVNHSLSNTSEEDLEFFYFGIAVQ